MEFCNFMARIIIEHCLKNITNHFELVLVASKRARDISTKNVKPFVDSLNDKPTVIALREIEDCKDLVFNSNIGE